MQQQIVEIVKENLMDGRIDKSRSHRAARGSADAQMPAEMAQERRQPHLGDALRLNDAEREIAPQITWKQALYGKVNDGLWYIGRCRLRTPVVPQHEENTRCERRV